MEIKKVLGMGVPLDGGKMVPAIGIEGKQGIFYDLEHEQITLGYFVNLGSN